jgi:hypothetical protein
MENICLFLYWDVGEPVSYSVQSLHLEVILSPVEWLVLEQELLTLPEHLSSPSVFSEVHVTQSLVLCVCFVDRCLSLCTFLLAIVLSVLRYTDSDYPFGVFKLFLLSHKPLKQYELTHRKLQQEIYPYCCYKVCLHYVLLL